MEGRGEWSFYCAAEAIPKKNRQTRRSILAGLEAARPPVGAPQCTAAPPAVRELKLEELSAGLTSADQEPCERKQNNRMDPCPDSKATPHVTAVGAMTTSK